MHSGPARRVLCTAAAAARVTSRGRRLCRHCLVGAGSWADRSRNFRKGKVMTTLKSMRRFWWVVALALGLPVTGCASGPTWKEEVVMFDGSKAVVERQQVLGNPLDRELSDITLGAPVKGNILRVPLSAGKWTSRWEAMGLNPQAVGLIAGIWYISATPKLCDDYDKWGRPIPPYVFFKYWRECVAANHGGGVSRRDHSAQPDLSGVRESPVGGREWLHLSRASQAPEPGTSRLREQHLPERDERALKPLGSTSSVTRPRDGER